MTENDVLTRLCALATKVAREQYQHKIPADCFCPDTSRPARAWTTFEFHPEVMAFIENAVNAALRTEVTS